MSKLRFFARWSLFCAFLIVLLFQFNEKVYAADLINDRAPVTTTNIQNAANLNGTLDPKLLLTKQGRATGDIATGVSGDINWRIDSTGNLIFSGNGMLSNAGYNVVLGSDTGEATSMNGWFPYAAQITQITFDNQMKAPDNMIAFFCSLPNLTKVNNANYLDMSGVTQVGWMFSQCPKLNSIDVSNWDLSNVTTMAYFFTADSSLTALNTTNWNTQKVNTFELAFYNCSNLTTIDVSNWNMSSAQSLMYIFRNDVKLDGLDVSKWDTSSVVDMQYAFHNCPSLTELDLSNWNVEKCTNFSAVVYSDHSLKTVDISKWKTTSAQTFFFAFADLNVTNLDVSNLDLTNANEITGMFWHDYNVQKLDTSKWNVTSKMRSANYVFMNCESIPELDLSSFDMTNVNAKSQMLFSLKNLRQLKLGPKTNIANTSLSEPNITGYGHQWRGVASGTIDHPLGNKAYSSVQLMADDGANPAGMADTYVLFNNLGAIDAKDSTLPNGAPWNPQDNFISVTDVDGNLSTDFSKVTEVDGSVDTSMGGRYPITYHYIDAVGVNHTKTINVTVIPLFSIDSVPTSWDFGKHKDQAGNYQLEQVNASTDASKNTVKITSQISNWQLNMKYDSFSSSQAQLTGTTLSLNNLELTNAAGTNIGGTAVNPKFSTVDNTSYAPVINMQGAQSSQIGVLTLKLGQSLQDVSVNIPQKPSLVSGQKVTDYQATVDWSLVDSIS